MPLCLCAFVTCFIICFYPRISFCDGVWERYVNSNEIRAIASRDDIIWCATSGGLARWDKRDGSYIRFMKHDGLLSNNLSALAIDENNFLWIGYEDMKGAVEL